jgi:hypothetical protein
MFIAISFIRSLVPGDWLRLLVTDSWVQRSRFVTMRFVIPGFASARRSGLGPALDEVIGSYAYPGITSISDG